MKRKTIQTEQVSASKVNTGNTVIKANKNHPKNGTTRRKTIEVPEDYFYRVKMRAVELHMKEKELWAEIVGEYFVNHPVAQLEGNHGKDRSRRP